MPERTRGNLPSVPIDVGGGPVVLLVHGQPGSGTDWAPLAGALQADHRVIAPDRPGWGQHPRPAVGIADNAVALERVLERCHAEPPVTVVGHSLGGGIALELAMSNPDLVGALVLLGSVGVSSAVSHFDRLLAAPVIGEGILRAGTAAVRRTVRAAARLPASRAGRRLDWLTSRVDLLTTMAGDLLDEPLTGRARASFVVEQRALLDETPSLERRLALVHLPVAVVTGTSDRIVPVAASRLLAEAIPGAELVTLPRAGHLAAFERTDEVAAVVRRYTALANGLRRPAGEELPR